jgi:hypothetical protein
MKRPQVIALTATLTDDYLPILSNLLTINSFTGNSLICGSPSDFSQQKIEMRSHITSNKGQYVSKGLTHISNSYRRIRPQAQLFFAILAKKLQHYHNNLKQKLNKMKLNVDVIHINGSLHMIDKFWRIHLFCDNKHLCKANFRVLVTTNAANVGIEKHLIALQMQFD